jgi:enamine deaminase RidA (YjgF/YER057c/UK114 family)
LGEVQKVNVDGLFRMPSTSHALMAGGTVNVSGLLGTVGAGLDLADGGVGGQTTQALRNLERVLAACGCGLADLVKVNVYLTDPAGFLEMDQAYAAVLGEHDSAPARIGVYCPQLPLGAAVELDATAWLGDRPEPG